jgi:hypothetical protein
MANVTAATESAEVNDLLRNTEVLNGYRCADLSEPS